MLDFGHVEFDILEVLYIVRSNDKSQTSVKLCECLPYCAFSCRLRGFSEIYSDGQLFRPDIDHYIMIPEAVTYRQHHFEEELIVVHLKFTRNQPEKIELVFCMDPVVKERFRLLYQLWLEKHPGYLCKCKSILYDIFSILQTQTVNGIRSKIAESMQYLYANFRNRDFSISEMIAKSYMSEAYFRRIFRELYGCSISSFISYLRVEAAKSLILARQYSMGEIAAMTGFSDEKYFSQVFRKFAGCVPSKYNR